MPVKAPKVGKPTSSNLFLFCWELVTEVLRQKGPASSRAGAGTYDASVELKNGLRLRLRDVQIGAFANE